MTRVDCSPHKRHRQLVEEIERECRVHEWRAGDVDLWPLASQDLFLDLFRDAGGNTAPSPPPIAARAAIGLATPALNLWKSRHDLAHSVSRPHRADAAFLGDGVSLDCVDGSWRDRFGEPVAAAIERDGRRCFAMQSGNLARLPWARPTYAANRVAARAALIAATTKSPEPRLPDHAAVLHLLEKAGVDIGSMLRLRLARRARTVAAQAALFERLLRRVRPEAAFVSTYYAGLGHGFALACRRLGILCVDLQHCPHDGTHRAYRWSKLPPTGYSTLPALFWTWTEQDADSIRGWAKKLDQPWHRAITGGHTQISHLRSGEGERLWDAAQRSRGDSTRYEREILVALQPIGGKRQLWSAFARAIATAPAAWRWWIRRHPASTPAQDGDYADLLALRSPNVVSGAAAQIALPALMSHMDSAVSLASGAAGEAAMFGVPAFFLDDEARDTFPGLLERGEAAMVSVESLVEAIANLDPRSAPTRTGAPPIDDTLVEIRRLARGYSRLVHSQSC